MLLSRRLLIYVCLLLRCCCGLRRCRRRGDLHFHKGQSGRLFLSANAHTCCCCSGGFTGEQCRAALQFHLPLLELRQHIWGDLPRRGVHILGIIAAKQLREVKRRICVGNADGVR